MLERLPYDYAIRFQAVFHSNSNFKKKIQLKRDLTEWEAIFSSYISERRQSTSCIQKGRKERREMEREGGKEETNDPIKT